MNQLRIALIIFGLIFVAINSGAQTGENVDVRAGINHGPFDRLLKKYVNEQGLVNYGAWKQSVADLSALDEYLHQFAAKNSNGAQGNEKAASLVNAYNALVLRWILSNDKAGGIATILGRYTPLAVREFAASGNYEVKYFSYNWGLNDQGPHGRNYGRAQLIFDNIFK
jgi:hypothetical protein